MQSPGVLLLYRFVWQWPVCYLEKDQLNCGLCRWLTFPHAFSSISDLFCPLRCLCVVCAVINPHVEPCPCVQGPCARMLTIHHLIGPYLYSRPEWVTGVSETKTIWSCFEPLVGWQRTTRCNVERQGFQDVRICASYYFGLVGVFCFPR